MALSRKQSREVAFRLIFSLSSPRDCELLDLALVVAGDSCGFDANSHEGKYISGLCDAVVKNIAEIDALIVTHAKDFSFDRIFKTDLAALRMAIGEIKFFSGTPAVVAINEAIEIAKKYGTEKSGGFVNGILAAVMK